ncbi:MAG: hypothetical protein M1834_007220 [Cirrosporium novae-zelandiae]|nr:MAG: hypothetical protein M1834_007220 [Cirrosporium novae-zelandiae]
MRSSTLSSFAGQAALPGGKADSLSESAWDTARREAYEEIGLAVNDQQLPFPFKIEHLCQLPINLARTELGVMPCVAFLHAQDADSKVTADVESNMIPRLDAKEVAAVFSAPFHNFLYAEDEGNSEELSALPGNPSDWYKGTWTYWHESPWRMHNFRVPVTSRTVARPRPKGRDQKLATERLKEIKQKGSVRRFRVFGMTARILVDAARIAYQQEPEFEHNSHFGDEDIIHRLQKLGRLGEIRKPGEELTREVLEKAAKI